MASMSASDSTSGGKPGICMPRQERSAAASPPPSTGWQTMHCDITSAWPRRTGEASATAAPTASYGQRAAASETRPILITAKGHCSRRMPEAAGSSQTR